jgi:hypothetical protein
MAATSGSSPQSSKQSISISPGNRRQLFTVVDFNVYYIEDFEGNRIPACITIGNIFGLKDIILGKSTLSTGDFFFWPCRMFYDTQVDNAMLDDNISRQDSLFLRDPLKKPLIVLSCLSKVDDVASPVSFKETLHYLKVLIDNAIDESSNTNPKKKFKLNEKGRNLAESEMDALIAVSKKIGAVNSSI